MPARSAAHLVVAVDIGNTLTKVGIIDAHALALLHRVSLPSTQVHEQLDGAVAELLDRQGVQAPLQVAVSCVLPSLRETAPGLLRNVAAGPVYMVGNEPWLPITVSYREPSRLGPDRLAAALCCHHRHPNANCTIIAAGTAVTIDYLRAGTRFEGGVIVPGIRAQLTGLHHCTGALPLLTDNLTAPTLPAADTEACIAAGVLYGLAGGVERIVAEYRALGAHTVVATGGAWPAIGPLVSFAYELLPDAVLVGTGLFALHACAAGGV